MAIEPDEFVVAGPWTNDGTEQIMLICPGCDVDVLDDDDRHTLAELRAKAIAHIQNDH